MFYKLYNICNSPAALEAGRKEERNITNLTTSNGEAHGNFFEENPLEDHELFLFASCIDMKGQTDFFHVLWVIIHIKTFILRSSHFFNMRGGI